jgi:hypothetical protein
MRPLPPQNLFVQIVCVILSSWNLGGKMLIDLTFSLWLFTPHPFPEHTASILSLHFLCKQVHFFFLYILAYCSVSIDFLAYIFASSYSFFEHS